jgi:pimeloyl-ACP methyl ester carboxylesterase
MCHTFTMTTFVLVHGAWSGSHVWGGTRRSLQKAGHQVFTPGLTGIGERVHLSGPLVGLSTHIHDVVNPVLYEDLDPIVLVGHSYGGMVVAGAVRHLRDRISDLVFLDAFVPKDGQSVRALGDAAYRDTPDAIRLGAPWAIPDQDHTFADPELSVWLNARRTPQPVLTFTEPVRLDRPVEEEDFRLTYLRAGGAPGQERTTDPFWGPGEVARQSPRWGYAEIASGHTVPQERPAELAELLQNLPQPVTG